MSIKGHLYIFLFPRSTLYARVATLHGHAPAAVASRFGDAEKRGASFWVPRSPHTMAAELARIIAKDDVVIFSYGGCPYCRRVTRALDAAGVPYNEVDYDDCDDGEAVRAEIRATHKQRSVPAVFVKGKFVGGCNDGPEPWMGVLPLLNSGKLTEWIRNGAAEA